jgi:hypothetical protein
MVVDNIVVFREHYIVVWAKPLRIVYFRVHAAIFDHTIRDALFSIHVMRTLGSATRAHARDRQFRAAPGITQDMSAASVQQCIQRGMPEMH